MNKCAKAVGRCEENRVNSKQGVLMLEVISESQKVLPTLTAKVIYGIRSGKGDHLSGVWMEVFC